MESWSVPSIIFRLSSVGSQGVGAYPSCLLTRGGEHFYCGTNFWSRLNLVGIAGSQGFLWIILAWSSGIAVCHYLLFSVWCSFFLSCSVRLLHRRINEVQWLLFFLFFNFIYHRKVNGRWKSFFSNTLFQCHRCFWEKTVKMEDRLSFQMLFAGHM